MPNKISLAIADDHTPFREGLMSLFEKYSDLRVVFDANDGGEVMEKLKTHSPDIVLMDLDMNGMNGEETLELIKQKYPEIKVIILTGHFNESFVVNFIKKQVPAILSKTMLTKKIVEAIRTVYTTGHYFDETVSEIMAKAIADSANDLNSKTKNEVNLNFQEIQVLKLMCLGLATKKIADKLHRSERTIDYNRNCIWHKTNIESKSISELILYALKHRILTIM
ncbi:hypothetical protein CNR22_18405 [Sphingobacteriaceae bacterium]|nr:hypothetical protein CNR22_18405 [Sphingobacteriaceae bacterium]